MTPDLIEKMARAMAKRNYPGASERDIDEMWDGWTEEDTAALSVAMDMIELARATLAAEKHERENPRTS